MDENDHTACVNAWMDLVDRGQPADALLSAFDRGFKALWRRTSQTLADVTLVAITERVLYAAAERYPFIGLLDVDETGLRSQALHKRVGQLKREELDEGIRFVLIEFLTILGNLTAEILTPALHSELSKTAQQENLSADDNKESGRTPQYRASDGSAGGNAE
ncbi:MAG: hypothetical protein JXB36_11305 [Gammaproteobacteria bacterium]|nr:hypothetical protein [Gammaproteobacteria bacterium]